MGEKRYEFGKNWQKFVSGSLNAERVDLAGERLLRFLGMESLEGKHFMDIGCGSGIHSLAALRGGASRVVSFDFDPDSVAATRQIRQLVGDPENWQVLEGSVLDRDFLSSLETADIIYSWGVLHHTGQMWQAIQNAAELLEPGALFYLALYSADMHVHPSQEYWLQVKQRYNRVGAPKRRMMELWYVLRYVMKFNPLAVPGLVRTMYRYKSERGMDFLTDARDWLGGWPMEFAKDRDVLKYFIEERHCTLENMTTGQTNTEFLFKQN